MARTPAAWADQPVVIDEEDAGELIDLLTDASWVIGHLAGVPAAEQACASAPAGPCGCHDLALDLHLAAAALDDAAAAAGHGNTYMTLLARKKAGPAGKNPRHAAEKQHSAEEKR